MIEKWEAGEVHFEDNAVGWKMADGEFRPLMDDAVAELVEAGLISESCAIQTAQARDEYTDRMLADYAANYTGPSDEERFEARAAFGEGQEIVNVITGHKWRT